MKQAGVDRLLGIINEQSVNVFYGFVNLVRGDLKNSARAGLEKAYSDNLIECRVAQTHISAAGATKVSRPSASDHKAEIGLFGSEG